MDSRDFGFQFNIPRRSVCECPINNEHMIRNKLIVSYISVGVLCWVSKRQFYIPFALMILKQCVLILYTKKLLSQGRDWEMLLFITKVSLTCVLKENMFFKQAGLLVAGIFYLSYLFSFLYCQIMRTIPFHQGL